MFDSAAVVNAPERPLFRLAGVTAGEAQPLNKTMGAEIKLWCFSLNLFKDTQAISVLPPILMTRTD